MATTGGVDPGKLNSVFVFPEGRPSKWYNVTLLGRKTTLWHADSAG